MTPVKMRRNIKLLDGKTLFTLYFKEMGAARSVGKVIQRITYDGIGTTSSMMKDSAGRYVNPFTGNPVYPMAIWFSVYSWAFFNLDESYKIFMEAMKDEGKYHSLEEWKHFVDEKTRTVLKNDEKRIRLWENRRKNGLTMHG